MTQVPSFYDPTDGKLTDLKAAHLSLHKCAKESKNFRKELDKVQEEFAFAKEDLSVYESNFAKSKLKSSRWTRSRGSQQALNSKLSLAQRSSNYQSANDWARGESTKQEPVKFSYPLYFMSEDYHLAESRNDEQSNIMMV